MKSIERLDVSKPSDITTSEVFSKAIEEAAQANRVMRDYIRIDESLRDSGGKTLHIPKGGEYSGDVSNISGGTVSPTTISLTDITVTPENYGIGAGIHQDTIREANYNTLDHTVNVLGEALAQHEDQKILGTLAQFSSGTVDATSGDAAGNITFKNVQDAKTGVMENDFNPDLMVIDPNTEAELGTISAFQRAGWYGSPKGEGYPETGKIGEVLGMDLVVTSNIATATSAGTASCIVTDSQHSILEAVQSPAEVQEEFETLEQTHEVLANQRFGIAKISKGATYVILTD